MKSTTIALVVAVFSFVLSSARGGPPTAKKQGETGAACMAAQKTTKQLETTQKQITELRRQLENLHNTKTKNSNSVSVH